MGKNNLYILFFVLILTFGHIQAQIDVACIGNSITRGSGLSDPGSQCYPARLGVRLGSDYAVQNYGEAARTALDVDQFSYILSNYYDWSTPPISPIAHEVVIILLGTNDSQEKYWADYSQFKEDYLFIMNSYKNYPNHEDPVFCLGLPPPVFEEHPDYNVSLGHLNEPIVSELIPMIKQVAHETGSTIADFYTALDGMPELFIDGVHPNVVGADIMAEVAYHSVQKALSTSDIPYNHPPDIPTGLRTISGYDNIHLEWHPNTEDDLWSYTIYRSDKEGGVQIWLGSVLAPDTTFSDINVVNDHIYYYSIAAMDNVNNYSDRTAAIVGITIDQIPPSAPVNLQAILEADSVKINWTPNTELDVEKYHIYRNTTLNNIQESSSLVGTVHEPDSNFIDLSFDSAINYFYGVTAIE
ncbi:GDSL-type esterase/lipase family protein [Candidatus Neomarinimicrobiota bacterium]